jgi:hypothetical protein
VVQLSLFRERAFSVGMAIAITFFLGIASFALILTLFLQIGLGFEPLHAGLTFLPFSGGVLVASGAAALSGRRRDPARGPVKPGFLVSRGVFSGGVPVGGTRPREICCSLWLATCGSPPARQLR